ncbi:uncharacterized protein EI90DRAFT_267384 [Cantharellus anzutake]|uniref:uncharacterized protein n=1 Tax=Cantharellus anzutake TaxID=1750568 RepID=UPI001908551B|nr:uncharacterized protein EI90DRAFT_267384 [Cantharellus anzutake]KAF8335854.1 hypothetical protein EI90DRAFT_267384 [Cantharellus anzutake]
MTQIANFYSTSLEALLDAESSATILHKITPFLVSGFVRLPPPLLCPNAFESFWTAKYKPITDELTREGYQYPEELKVCLRYFIYSGSEHESFAVGLSAGIESIDEVNEESFVPESVNVEAPTRSSPDHSSLVADDAERIANNPGLENASFVPEHQILVANSSSSDVPDDPDIARIISTDQLPSSPDDTGRLSPAVISSDKIADVSVPSLLGNPIRGHQALSSPDGVSDEEAEANSVATSLVEGEMFSSPKPQQRVYGPGSSGKRKRGLSGKLARKRHRPRKSEDTSSFIASLVRGTMGPSPHLPAVKSHSDRPPEPKPAPKAGHAPKLDLVTPTKVGSNAPERHGKVEVEVPRLVQAWKGHKARSSSVSNEPSPCSSPTDHRRSQRLKRDLSALNVNEEVLPQTDGNKIGPPRPKRHKSSTDISPQRQNPRSRKSKKSFASGSSDVTSPQKGPTPSVNSETPQIRGPVLPALVDTVISPELKRNEQLDNPSSDDSTQPGSSPIRSHVQRRLSRNNSSGLLGPKSRLNVHRVPAPDSIKDAALILASTSNEQLVSMSAEELRHLRSLIDGLEGKVQNALSSKSDS